jgi:hypothetical protein
MIHRSKTDKEWAVARLAIINSGKLVKTIELGAGEMMIGRGDDVAIQLKHPLISRAHARVYLTPAGYLVEDQGTKNGTFVGGRRVQRHRLVDGDELEVADFILQYHADGFVPVDDELPPADPKPAGGGGMVSGSRKSDAAKSPLEAYMEALKRKGHNATTAISPDVMAEMRLKARQQATPRLQVDGAEELITLENRVTLAGFGDGNQVQLTGRWLWINEAARFTREDVKVVIERISFWCPVKVNGSTIRSATPVEIKPGDRIKVGKRMLVLMEGEAAL